MLRSELHCALISAIALSPCKAYYEAILRLGEIGVLPTDFARRLAPLAGLRNALLHEYVNVDWNKVHQSLKQLDDLSYA